jgi:hypothetical protein
MGIVVSPYRTEIDDCEDATDWSGGSTNDSFNLQGTFCLGEKVSQTTGAENMYTFPGANPDMTGEFIVMTMQVTGAADTVANGGFRILVEDGNTDRGTWYVGGSDTSNQKWSYFAVDPSTAPTLLNGFANNAKAVTSLSRSGTTATCTTTAVHGLATNDYVIISGASPGAYNGYFQITVTSTTVFTYTIASGTDSATGTIDLKQGVDATDVDKVGVQFKVVTKAVGNTPNALWDICWYGDGLQVTSSLDTLTSLTRSGTTVTATFTAHGLEVGDRVRISGAVETDYNGDWVVATVPLTSTFTYEVATTPTSPATGTITAQGIATWQHIVDADAAGFWGLCIQIQGVNYMQGRFVLGSLGAADDLLFIDDSFKCIFKENLFLPPAKNNILPAKNASGDNVEIEWSNGIISSYVTQWGFSFGNSNFVMDTFLCTGVTFEGCNGFTAENTVDDVYSNCIWTNCLIVIPNLSTLTGCQYINAATGHIGMTWPASPNNISDMRFSNNTYSIFMTQSADQTFDGMVFDDLGTDLLVSNGGLDHDVLNTNGSNANSAANIGGGTTTFILDPVTTQYTVTDTDQVAISGARVFLETSDGTGPLPFEESVSIVQVAGVATVTHTAHGIPTGTQAVIRGATQNGYNKVAVITVTGVNTYTYAVDSGTVSPATGSPVASGVIIHTTTNGSGIVSDTREFITDQPFKGFIRDSSGSPYHVAATVLGTISSTAGFTAIVALQPDE